MLLGEFRSAFEFGRPSLPPCEILFLTNFTVKWREGRWRRREEEIREEKKGVYEKGQELGRIKES